MTDILVSYRENASRCDFLRIEIAETERALQELQSTAISYEAVPGVQQLTGMPHGGKIGRPTEEVAIMFASGDAPRYISEMQKSLREMQQEYKQCTADVGRADAWLKSLKERERWVVTRQMIDGAYWQELTREYEKRFGEHRSKRCLQIVKKNALRKIVQKSRKVV